MATLKTRHQFYLPDDLSKRLDRLTAKPGVTKTAILTEALRAWLDREATREIDARFGPRLDRQGRATEQIARDVNIVMEMLGVFVQNELALTAHQPRLDEETRRIGRRRYEGFLDLVAERVARRSVPALLNRSTEPHEEPHEQEDEE